MVTAIDGDIRARSMGRYHHLRRGDIDVLIHERRVAVMFVSAKCEREAVL